MGACSPGPQPSADRRLPPAAAVGEGLLKQQAGRDDLVDYEQHAHDASRSKPSLHADLRRWRTPPATAPLQSPFMQSMETQIYRNAASVHAIFLWDTLRNKCVTPARAGATRGASRLHNRRRHTPPHSLHKEEHERKQAT